MTEQVDKYSAYSLRHSQKYRQWAAPSRFMSILINTAIPYGLEKIAVEPRYTTIPCNVCGEDNEVGPTTRFLCQHCGTPNDKPSNAARNIADCAMAEN